jgi:CRISPR/Cas system CSM-associated protein Csm5 (group 7 of RAMP superfamily)
MNAELSENITRYIKLEVLTPVHVGAGPDKKWIKDVDFFYDSGKIIVFDLAETLKNKDENFISYVAHAISKRELFNINLIQKNDIKKITEYKFNKCPDEIFSEIRTGLGIAYIPGSSLKGAISSAILGFLYKNDNEIKLLGRDGKINEKVFGKIENSVMRLLQITDATFNNCDLNLFNTKIYSLGMNLKGEWKHDLKNKEGDRKKFNEEKFVNVYECLKPESISFFRIVIVKNIVENYAQESKFKNLDKVFKIKNSNAVVELFKMINQQTKNYLDKEIEFFDEHKGDQSEKIIEKLKNLKEIAEKCKNAECILHLGSGSGFHGITGDWQFDSHIIDRIKTIQKNGRIIGNRGQINGKDAAKSRRLVFEKKGYDYEFYPMGFVKLSMVEKKEYEEHLEKIKESNQNRNQKASFSNTTSVTSGLIMSNQANQEKESQVTNEIKPFEGKIKAGQGGIPAEIIESGSPNKVKIYIKNYTIKDVFDLKLYRNPLEKGRRLYVRIADVNKDNEILEVSFDKFMN